MGKIKDFVNKIADNKKVKIMAQNYDLYKKLANEVWDRIDKEDEEKRAKGLKVFAHKDVPAVLACEENAGLRNNKDFVLAAVTICNFDAQPEIAYVSDELKNDKEVAMAAVTHNANALKYVSDELKGDKDVVITAVKKDLNTLEFASDKIASSKEIIMVALSSYPMSLENCEENIKNNKEFVMAAVAHNGLALEFASDELKNDDDVVKAAYANNPNSIEFADYKLILRARNARRVAEPTNEDEVSR